MQAASAAMPPWRERLQASLANNAKLVYSKYMQLATVKLGGGAAVRNVVFRGFLDGSDDLTFVTDIRSRKVQEIAANSEAEVCWYFPETREQYRLTGKVSIIQAQHQEAALLQARQNAWDRLSDAGRLQFSWPEPGLPRDINPGAFTASTPGPKQPPLDTFCLGLVSVNEVDYIQLFDNIRATFKQAPDGSWLSQEVNP